MLHEEPSRVPDWTNKSSSQSLEVIRVRKDNSSAFDFYQAALNYAPTLRISSDLRVVTVKAAIVDTPQKLGQDR